MCVIFDCEKFIAHIEVFIVHSGDLSLNSRDLSLNTGHLSLKHVSRPSQLIEINKMEKSLMVTIKGRLNGFVFATLLFERSV